MLDSIQDYVKNHYPSKMSIVGGIICAAAAIEMAIHVPYTISQINQAATGALEPLKYSLSANLGGAIFYSLCALNIVPRTAGVGASIFTFYSLVNFQKEGTYVTSQCIGKVADFVAQKFIVPFCQNVLFPAIGKITELAKKAIEMIGSLMIKMPLPQHPAWIGVFTLGAAIAIYKFVFPYFWQSKT